MDVSIAAMTEADIDRIMATFSASHWNKERVQYERYWAEQERGVRVIFVASLGETVVGYGTLVWEPNYVHFREAGIPEIVDLNVDPPYRKRGIATAIIAQCEAAARAKGLPTMGISVVMDDPDYAAARRLYPALGYVADEHGIDAENELHLTRGIA